MNHMLLREHISGAYHSLRRTRTRTALTILGVAIGVCSITTILSLSRGVSDLVKRQVASVGDAIIVIRPGYSSEQNSVNFGDPLGNTSYSTSTLSMGDYKDVAKLPHVKDVAPIMLISGMMKGPEAKQGKLGSVVATTPAFARINNIEMDSGQFLDGTTADNTAVIGEQLGVNLFGTQSPVGQQFSLRGQTFTVIGVLKRTNNPVNFNNFDLDTAAYINIDSGVNFHQGSAQIQQVDVRADHKANLEKVKKSVASAIAANHLGEHDFTITSGETIAQPTNRLFLIVTAIMTAIAAISSIVGGIGIMNIMLVGVAERTREIGLRKAVGASNRQITIQFMIESLLMSLAGGVLGFVSGYILAFLISASLPFFPSISWQIPLVALGISLAVGIVFGAYPALRAAQKDAIESLRAYH